MGETSDRSSFYDGKYCCTQEIPHEVEYSIGHITDEHSKNSVTGSAYSNTYDENSNKLIAEIMEMKLQLAKARSEVDHTNLRLSRVTLERDTLRNQQAQFIDKSWLESTTIVKLHGLSKTIINKIK